MKAIAMVLMVLGTILIGAGAFYAATGDARLGAGMLAGCIPCYLVALIIGD